MRKELKFQHKTLRGVLRSQSRRNKELMKG